MTADVEPYTQTPSRFQIQKATDLCQCREIESLSGDMAVTGRPPPFSARVPNHSASSTPAPGERTTRRPRGFFAELTDARYWLRPRDECRIRGGCRGL